MILRRPLRRRSNSASEKVSCFSRRCGGQRGARVVDGGCGGRVMIVFDGARHDGLGDCLDATFASVLRVRGRQAVRGEVAAPWWWEGGGGSACRRGRRMADGAAGDPEDDEPRPSPGRRGRGSSSQSRARCALRRVRDDLREQQLALLGARAVRAAEAAGLRRRSGDRQAVEAVRRGRRVAHRAVHVHQLRAQVQRQRGLQRPPCSTSQPGNRPGRPPRASARRRSPSRTAASPTAAPGARSRSRSAVRALVGTACSRSGR